MEQWLSYVIEQFRQWPPLLMYLGLFTASYIENIIPPIPGDTVTVFGAYLIGIGVIEFWQGWMLTNAGSVAGFYTMFLIGKWLGSRFLQRGGWWFFRVDHYEKVSGWIERYGYGVVLANRFLSGARSIISLSAGICRMKDLPVLLLALLSSVVWNGALIYGGMKLGENWDEVLEIVKRYNQVIFGLVAVLLLAWTFRYFRRRRTTA